MLEKDGMLQTVLQAPGHNTENCFLYMEIGS